MQCQITDRVNKRDLLTGKQQLISVLYFLIENAYVS